MALVICNICKQRGEAKTYEEAAELIQHGAGSRKCPGGPAVVLSYIDDKGIEKSTIPKKTVSATPTKKKKEATEK